MTRVARWGAVAAYAGLIFFLSSQPLAAHEPLFPHSDKVVHIIEYGILGLLFRWAIGGTWPATHGRTLALWAIVLSTLYGVTDEVHQAFVPFRTAEVADVAADAVGAALAQLLCYRVRS